MGQMTPLVQTHPQYQISGLQHGKVHCCIGLCAGMGLHICMLRAKELASAISGDILHGINTFTAAIIALARITLGILIGEMAAHGGHDRFGYEIFGGDQLNVGTLPLQLFFHGLGHHRIRFAN
ncbi:hypothetical protein SDC9_142678 [bioreactor metagenome]|uniref:Uncharacterized protein n=1 Tax=bioreactor metagenome TaxID=1076179 RepID=A0A645E3Z0_9ZZZZ